jgi:hypothetical protein
MLAHLGLRVTVQPLNNYLFDGDKGFSSPLHFFQKWIGAGFGFFLAGA